MLSFSPRGVLDEILNFIESVSEGFPSYSCVPILITTFPSNLSETYPWPRYGVPSTCLGHSIYTVDILAYPSI